MERFVMMTPFSNVDDSKAIIDCKKIFAYRINDLTNFTIKKENQIVTIPIGEITLEDIIIKDGESFRLLCNLKSSRSMKALEHKKASGISLAFFIKE